MLEISNLHMYRVENQNNIFNTLGHLFCKGFTSLIPIDTLKYYVSYL